MKYDWPETKALVALVHEYGQAGAARRLGCPRSTLESHLERCGLSDEDRRQAPKSLNEEALREVAKLVR